MELQRCVWSCLANSRGNTDPAYHACVDRLCTEPSGAPPAPAPAARGVNAVNAAGTADRMTVTVVQRALMDLGLYPGPIDGIYGGGTAAAVRAFRESRGLGSGGIDGDLVYSLRRESAAARPSARP